MHILDISKDKLNNEGKGKDHSQNSQKVMKGN